MTQKMPKRSLFKFSDRPNENGLTLIEALIYSALLSFLISGFIQYAYGVRSVDYWVMDQINNPKTQND